jgi:hypothetical protein
MLSKTEKWADELEERSTRSPAITSISTTSKGVLTSRPLVSECNLEMNNALNNVIGIFNDCKKCCE